MDPVIKSLGLCAFVAFIPMKRIAQPSCFPATIIRFNLRL